MDVNEVKWRERSLIETTRKPATSGNAQPLPPHAPPIHWRREALAALLESGQPQWVTLSGGSMRPLLEPGAGVELVPARSAPDGSAAVRAGDLVVFDGGGALVCHRVVGVDRSSGGIALLEKGDAFWRVGRVAPGEILARVRRIRVGGRTIPLEGRVVRVLSRLAAVVGVLAARAAEATCGEPGIPAGSPHIADLRRLGKFLANLPARLLRWVLLRRSG